MHKIIQRCSERGLLHHFHEEQRDDVHVLATPEAWECYKSVYGIEGDPYQAKTDFMGTFATLMINRISNKKKAIYAEFGPQSEGKSRMSVWYCPLPFEGHVGIVIADFSQCDEMKEALSKSLPHDWFRIIEKITTGNAEMCDVKDAPFYNNDNNNNDRCPQCGGSDPVAGCSNCGLTMKVI